VGSKEDEELAGYTCKGLAQHGGLGALAHTVTAAVTHLGHQQ